MFSIVSFIFHNWHLLAIAAGLASVAAWYSGLLAVRDLAAKVIGFVTSRIGIALIMLCLGLSVGFFGSNNEIVLERLRSENVALQRDATISHAARLKAEHDAARLESESTSNDSKVSNLEQELRDLRDKQPPDPKVIVETKIIKSCPATDEAVRRLKEIK